MDRTVPAGAAILLNFIRETEVGRKDRASYDFIYANKQHKVAKPLTSMTLDEVLAAQRAWSKNHGSSAAGGYQFMRATLLGLIEELGLRGSQKLDPDLQDRLGYHLLKCRGYEGYTAGRISRAEFGKRLAANTLSRTRTAAELCPLGMRCR
jgi:muramidase (phage lysozyme)